MSLKDYASVKRLAARALDNGATFSGGITTEWDISGNCQNPYGVTIKGVKAPGHIARQGDPGIIYVLVNTRCRRCPPCLRARGYAWEHRCAYEIYQSRWLEQRIWFATFTFKPQFHLWALGELGSDPDTYAKVARIANRPLTLWFKTMRKKSEFRYCAVMEPHKSGVPHLHALLHETDKARPLKERQMREAWSEIGFFHAKLINPEEDVGRSASYLSKYLTKKMLARVRASTSYGRTA